MTLGYGLSLLLSLFLTLVFEFLVAAVWGITERHDLLLLLISNALTNPAAVTLSSIFQRAFSASVYLWQLPIETVVVIAEWLLYKKCGKSIKCPLTFSIAANAFSYGVGLLLTLVVIK